MKDKWLKKFLIWSLFPYGSTRTILIGPCKGMKVHVTPQLGHAVLRGYEKKSQMFLKKKIKHGMTVYDVGAHCGQYSLFFAKAVREKGCVVSFEPLGENFTQLQKNLDLNHLSWVVSYKYALTDKDGTAEFCWNPSCSSMGKIDNVEPTFNTRPTQKMQVEARRLDSLLGLCRPPNIIKIDAEGSAGLVLKGALETLKKYSPLLFIELHGPDERSSVGAYLKELDYQVMDLGGRHVSDITSRWVSPIWCYKTSGIE